MTSIAHEAETPQPAPGAESLLPDPLAPDPLAEPPHRRATDTPDSPRLDALRAQWRPLIGLLLLLLAAITGLYWDTARSMIEIWYRSKTFNHGFIIAPITLYLIWDRRHLILTQSPKPAPLGLLLLAGCAFGWLLGEVTGVVAVKQLAYVMILQATVFTVLGWNVTRRMAFPLLFLFFAVPVGDFLVPPMQDITADITVKGLQLSGIPVYLDGVFLSIPSGNFEVAEACSGVRYLIAMFALGCLVANQFYRAWWRRLLFLGLSIVVPIFANGIRAYGIVILAHLSDYKLAVGIDHIIYGWFFFALVMLMLLGLGMTFRQKDMMSLESETAYRRTAARDVPVTPFHHMIMASAVSVTVLAAAPAYASFVAAWHADQVAGVVPEPLVAAPWARDRGPSDWTPEYPGTDASLFRRYRNGDRVVDLYIAYYAVQREGAEVVSWINHPAQPAEWQRAAITTDQVAVDGQAMDVQCHRILGRRGARLALQWYWVDGRFTSSAHLAKLLQAKAVLFGGNAAAAVVVLSTPVQEDKDEAIGAMANLLAAVGDLDSLLERTAGRPGQRPLTETDQ
ncbi:MAG: exosortase A [Rhodobacterales bacterium]|nr:exosortase A [Rhodobacterales bacterium]